MSKVTSDYNSTLLPSYSEAMVVSNRLVRKAIMLVALLEYILITVLFITVSATEGDQEPTNDVSQLFQQIAKPMLYDKTSAALNYISDMDVAALSLFTTELFQHRVYSGNNKLVSIAIERLIEINSEAALDDIGDEVLAAIPTRANVNLQRTVMTTFARMQPLRTLGWIEVRDELLDDQLRRELYRVLSRSNPDSVLDSILLSPRSERREIDLVTMLTVWGESDASAAGRMMLKHIPEGRLMIYFSGIIGSMLESDPRAALEIMDKLPSTVDVRNHLRYQGQARAKLDALASYNWARSLTGPQYDSLALDGVITEIAMNDPDLALELVNSLDDDLRIGLFHTLISSVAQYHSDRIEGLLNKADISAEQRREVEQQFRRMQ